MQSPTTLDPVKVASHNYRVLLENKRVRALEYRSKPGDRTEMHSHPACLIYSFCPSTIRINVPYGESAGYEFQAGQLLWVEESIHNTENIGFTEAHLLIVELKEPP